MSLYLYLIIFLYGIIIGSFLNVCIYRIPLKEDIVLKHSHCMSCGYQLRWYDLIPVFSYLALRGRCRKCRSKISIQYPVIELLNGILYILVFLANGFSMVSLLYCMLVSALIVLSVIDFRIYEIPSGINLFILVLGFLRMGLDYKHWYNYLIGLLAVSLFFCLLFLITKGKAIGGGDIKLMAAAGLVLGWRLIILSFFLGCLLGSVIHITRMKVNGEGSVLAFGPYLSMGIFLAVIYGERLIHWYLQICLG